MDISIIIVNYKTQVLTMSCIESVYRSNMGNLAYEIVVVDNASDDGSIEAIEKAYPQARIIKNTENLGFSKANNIGIRTSEANYILLLNSDTIVEPTTIKDSVTFLERHPNAGALGCKVLLENGQLDPSCKRSFPTPSNGLWHTLKLDQCFKKSKKFGEYNLTFVDDDKIFSIDCVMGAYMLVTRAVIEKVGLLDEDYFMYGEDVDWCYRIKQAGFQIIYYPKVKIVHYKKASGIEKRNPKVIAAFYDSMAIFYRKHYIEKYNKILTNCVIKGTIIMKKVALFKNNRKGKKHD